MEGYTSLSYGDGFADVYDRWYGALSDPAAIVALLNDLVGPGASILELGVGTGRLAVPLATAGFAVTGIDSSPAMLERCRALDSASKLQLIEGDMVDDLPMARFDLVLAAYNTVFNLLDASRQQACFTAVADRLNPGGRLVLEAFVPGETAPEAATETQESTVSVREITATSVTLSVSRHNAANRTAEGQFIELSETGGVRLRPWMIHYCSPDELDAMAATAGLELEQRYAGFDLADFGPESTRHVSIYRQTGSRPK